MTYSNLYEYGRLSLEEAGIEEANLDARLLLEAVCNTDRNMLLVHGDCNISLEETQTYVNHILKRKTHVPLQYILGSQEFMGLTFLVSENVLIPRQDTEVLVEEAMKYLHDGMRVLDMCTGSGCILLSLLHYSNDCTGVGADISADALSVAKENARNLSIEADFIESDLFDKIDGIFDMIVSNPPYIQTEVIKTLSEEVKVHEPMIALDGHEDGMYFYKKIITDCKTHLYRGGRLLFEIGYDQSETVSKRLQQAGFKEVEVIKDLAGLDRVVTGIFLEDKDV